MFEQNYRVVVLIQGFYLLLLSTCVHISGAAVEPCKNYTAINDTTLTVAYRSSVVCQEPPSVKWYRYTATANGRMANTCPQGLQCGSNINIWFNDITPTVSDGEVKKQICVHEVLNCCTQNNKIQTKNCTDFIVYMLTKPTQNCTNYCYEAPASGKGNNGSKNSAGLILMWTVMAACVGIRSNLF